MEKLVLTIPTLFGDHHTTAVRKILEDTKGIEELYVSSAFNQVAVSYDPKKVKPEAIRKALAEQGYSEGSEPVLPAEALPVGESTTRHTSAYTGIGDTLAFAETAPSWEGRPLWPCPGFEPTMDNE
jgi:copper chaperone CopZ